VIRAVLFDFYGTLARAVSWGPTVQEVLASHGVELNPEAQARWRDEATDGVEHIEHSVDRARYVAWERARLTRLTTACGVAQPEAVVEALYRAIKAFTLVAYDEVRDVLDDLRARRIVLAVCSNWDWDLTGAIEGSGLAAGLFDAVVTSAQAGARKPHPRIYERTLDRCGGIAPQDALFVGDTWGPDVEGPRRMGMRSVQVCREGEGRPGGEGAPRITDLWGVADFL